MLARCVHGLFLSHSGQCQTARALKNAVDFYRLYAISLSKPMVSQHRREIE